MFLFRSKFVWVCALLCVVAIALFGVVVYQGFRQQQEPIKVYKVTKPRHRTASPEKPLEPPATSSSTGVTTVDELDSAEVDSVDADVEDGRTTVDSLTDSPMPSQDNLNEKPLTVDDSQTTGPNDNITNGDFSAEDFAQEIQTRFMSVMSRYPILSMSESEMLDLMQTREGRLTVQRQAEEIRIEMINLGNKYIPLLSDEEKRQAKEESRRILSEYLTPPQIEAYLSQFPW